MLFRRFRRVKEKIGYDKYITARNTEYKISVLGVPYESDWGEIDSQADLETDSHLI